MPMLKQNGIGQKFFKAGFTYLFQLCQDVAACEHTLEHLFYYLLRENEISIRRKQRIFDVISITSPSGEARFSRILP